MVVGQLLRQPQQELGIALGHLISQPAGMHCLWDERLAVRHVLSRPGLNWACSGTVWEIMYELLQWGSVRQNQLQSGPCTACCRRWWTCATSLHAAVGRLAHGREHVEEIGFLFSAAGGRETVQCGLLRLHGRQDSATDLDHDYLPLSCHYMAHMVLPHITRRSHAPARAVQQGSQPQLLGAYLVSVSGPSPPRSGSCLLMLGCLSSSRMRSRRLM